MHAPPDRTPAAADFGLARVVLDLHGALMTGGLGTFQWMAPEVLAHQRYSEKADVFSCAAPGRRSLYLTLSATPNRTLFCLPATLHPPRAVQPTSPLCRSPLCRAWALRCA
jgi:serine/threonine protein kinase